MNKSLLLIFGLLLSSFSISHAQITAVPSSEPIGSSAQMTAAQALSIVTAPPSTAPVVNATVQATGGSGFSVSTIYYYRVQAVNSFGATSQSTEATCTTSASGSSQWCAVSWPVISNATQYVVEGRTISGNELIISYVSAANCSTTCQYNDTHADTVIPYGTPLPTANPTIPVIKIANGTVALSTTSIAATTCTVTAVTSTPVLNTDVITWSAKAPLGTISGYAPSSNGSLGLDITPQVSGGGINIEQCNYSSSSITPGAVSINWTVNR